MWREDFMTIALMDRCLQMRGLIKDLSMFLSTMHSSEPSNGSSETVMRRKQDGTQEAVVCPPLVLDYWRNMWSVDSGDKLIGCYNIG